MKKKSNNGKKKNTQGSKYEFVGFESWLSLNVIVPVAEHRRCVANLWNSYICWIAFVIDSSSYTICVLCNERFLII